MSRSSTRVALFIMFAVCTLWIVRGLAAQEPTKTATSQKPAGQEATLRIGSEEVLLDVVVRDKRGRPVNDLKAEELEVFEDGVKQQVTSFRRRSVETIASENKTAGNGARATANNASVDPLRQINLVTLVFERLNNESRVLARDAALEFIRAELGQNVMVAVFTLDQRLNVLQQFTNDREKLKAAVERAAGMAASQFADQSESIRRELERLTSAQANLESASANAQNGGAAGIGQAAVDAKLAQMTIDILRMTDDSQRQQQGTSSLYSLMALIKEQQRLIGRKTVLYFSEGLVVTPALKDRLQMTISNANRANVSFYSVDARGLQTARTSDAARESLAAAVKANEQQMRSRGNQPVTPEQIKAMDTAESSVLKDAQQNLATIAESTGGFLIANTNDLRAPMRRIASELASYYELSYAPAAREYDGKFRTIKVQTSRSDVVLQTRNGYFALPPGESGGAPVAGFEMPLLAALSTTKLPREFEYRTATMRFESNAPNTHHTLVLEVPLGNLTFQSDAEKKVYRTHFALLALLKTADGQVVQKFSKDQPLEGALDQLSALQTRSYLFENNFWLTPGRYTLETVAQDRQGGRISARRAVLIVPPPRQSVAMSSIVVIKRTNPPDPNIKDSESPLLFSAGRIIPNLGDPILPAPGTKVSLYFVVYPARDVSDKPKLTLEFLLDGEVLARATPELSEPDAQGRISYIATVPMETFKAGRYEVRAVIQQNQQAVEEHAFFTIGETQTK